MWPSLRHCGPELLRGCRGRADQLEKFRFAKISAAVSAGGARDFKIQWSKPQLELHNFADFKSALNAIKTFENAVVINQNRTGVVDDITQIRRLRHSRSRTRRGPLDQF